MRFGCTIFSGGIANSMSLRQLQDWCGSRFPVQEPAKESSDRPFDIPWMVLDSSLAKKRFGWQPATPISDILAEIQAHAEQNPNWLDWTS